MKRWTHKLMGILLAVMLLVCLLPTMATPASAALIAEGDCGDSIHWILDGTTLTLTGNGAMYDYDFDYGTRYDYTKAKTPWAKYTTQITTVKIAPAITHIGEMAFFQFTKLTSVEAPGVLTVGNDAFNGCTALTSISLPAAVTIGNNAFYGCSRLAALDLSKVVSVGDAAFSHAPVVSVTMESAKYIGKSAFEGCYQLAEVSLPAVENIGNSAFKNCKQLTAVNFPNAVNVGEKAFADCHKLASINLPKLTLLKQYTFQNCIALTSVELPAVLSMESYPFSGCTALSSLSMASLMAVPNHGFELAKNLVIVDMPSVNTLGEYAFNACENLQVINIPNLVTMKANAFRHCSSLTEISIPKATAISNNCFYGCASLQKIDAPLVTRVGNFAFQECYALQMIDFPALTYIGNCGFYLCTSLTEAYIPAVKTIDQNGFNTCSSLSLLYVSTDLETVNARAFEACKSLKTIYVKQTKPKWEPLTVATLNNDYFTKAKIVYGAPPFSVDPLPDYITVCTGTNAQLSVVTHGLIGTFQWQVCAPGSTTWTDIKGATAATVSYGPMTMDKTGTLLRCKVTSRDGVAAVSESVEIKVSPFADTDAGAYYFKPLLWAVDSNITTGTTKTTFSPYASCTRGQVVTFLWRAAGSPEPTTTENPFSDVSEGAFYKAILWAVEKGITTGYADGTFRPGAACTRGQIATFLWRAAGSPEPTTTENPFPDVAEGAFYKAILWAVEQDITTGYNDSTFRPGTACTRAHIVTFLYRNYN